LKVATDLVRGAPLYGEISGRSNVVVMADKAHRSQYRFVDGDAKWMRDALHEQADKIARISGPITDAVLGLLVPRRMSAVGGVVPEVCRQSVAASVFRLGKCPHDQSETTPLRMPPLIVMQQVLIGPHFKRNTIPAFTCHDAAAA